MTLTEIQLHLTVTEEDADPERLDELTGRLLRDLYLDCPPVHLPAVELVDGLLLEPLPAPALNTHGTPPLSRKAVVEDRSGVYPVRALNEVSSCRTCAPRTPSQ